MALTPGSLSAAVCTRDRPALLREALRSLAAQQPPLREILVVDNAPADDRTRRLVETEFPGARYLLEPAPGLDFARNRALAAARGDIVAFLDDDALATPDWGAHLAAAFASAPGVALVTGRIQTLELETDAQRLFEANGGFDRGEESILLPADASRRRLHGRRAPLIAWAVSVGSGCSMAVRRSVALDLGGFDEALDLGARLPGGGDHDLLWRVLRAGHQVRYDPAVRAVHRHRCDLAAASAQIAGHQRALVAWLSKHALSSGPPVAGFLAWRLLKPGARLLRRARGHDPLPARLLWRVWGACWVGLFAYPAARREAARRRSRAS